MNFENDFPNSKIILLEENYRSTQKILDCANELIKNNVNRKEKNLWTKKEGGDEIIYKSYQNENYEAIEVAQNVSNLIFEGYNLSDIAVLYRGGLRPVRGDGQGEPSYLGSPKGFEQAASDVGPLLAH